MSEFIRLQANGADAYPDASTENTYRPNGTSVESALVNLESNVTTLGGVAGEAKTLAEQNSVKIATAEQEISDINSSLNGLIKTYVTSRSIKMAETGNGYLEASDCDIDFTKYRFLCGHATTGYNHSDTISVTGFSETNKFICYQWINGRNIDLPTTFYINFIRIA